MVQLGSLLPIQAPQLSERACESEPRASYSAHPRFCYSAHPILLFPQPSALSPQPSALHPQPLAHPNPMLSAGLVPLQPAASTSSDYSDVSDADEPTYAAWECNWCGSEDCAGPDMCGH